MIQYVAMSRWISPRSRRRKGIGCSHGRTNPSHQQIAIFAFERCAQHFDRQLCECALRNRRKAQMPRLGCHASTVGVVRPEEAVAVHVRIEPGIQPAKRAVGRVLDRQQFCFYALARSQRAPVDHVDLRPPMMAARARHGRPAEHGVDQLGLAERRVLEAAALAIVERALAAILLVPDPQLGVEVAKAADRHHVETGSRRRGAQLEKGLHGVAVQGAVRVIELDDVGARAPGELEFVHPRSSCAGVQRCRRRCKRCSLVSLS